MRRPSQRRRVAARIALPAALCLSLLVATGGPVAAAAPVWPVATTGPTVLTSQIWFRGRGYGHGVGLSQYGARGRALAGQDHPTILAHYYKGTTLGAIDPATAIRVRVLSGFTPTTSNPFTIVVKAGSATVGGVSGTFPAGSVVSVTKVGSAWRLRVLSAGGSELARKDGISTSRVTPVGSGALLQLPPRTSSYDTYRGILEIRAATTLAVVNEIGIDLYLRGVVPAEMPASWPQTALRAQAIAARSYAMYKVVHATGSYDITDGSGSQVYFGQEREATATNTAIASTAGVVVKSGSSIANALFHSAGGGATEDNEKAFVSSSGAIVAGPVSYLRGSSDLRPDGTSYDDASPLAYWQTATYEVASLSAIFAGDARTNVGTLTSLDLSSRGVSGRLIRVVLRGTAGTKTVSGDVFREVFNARNASAAPDIRSTLVDLVQMPARLRVAPQSHGTPFG